MIEIVASDPDEAVGALFRVAPTRRGGIDWAPFAAALRAANVGLCTVIVSHNDTCGDRHVGGDPTVSDEIWAAVTISMGRTAAWLYAECDGLGDSGSPVYRDHRLETGPQADLPEAV